MTSIVPRRFAGIAATFAREITQLRRQPRLWATLVVQPFLLFPLFMLLPYALAAHSASQLAKSSLTVAIDLPTDAQPAGIRALPLHVLITPDVQSAVINRKADVGLVGVGSGSGVTFRALYVDTRAKSVLARLW